jgi:molybdate transport system substrate-binding protein
MTGLQVFAVNGVKEVLSRIAERSSAAVGEQVRYTFGTIGALQDRMAAGDTPDVLIAMSAAMAKAEAAGLIAQGASFEVGRTGLAMVVKQGAASPDISSAAAFRDALLSAKSLAYTDPKTGAASGIAVAKIIEQLGIVDAVKGKTVLVGGGPVGKVVAEGQAELGIQQVTELLPVKGIAFVERFPSELQCVTVYQAAVLRRTERADGAAKFVSFITSPEIKQCFAEAGFGRY